MMFMSAFRSPMAAGLPMTLMTVLSSVTTVTWAALGSLGWTTIFPAAASTLTILPDTDVVWAEAAAHALAPASLLRVASDHEEYFGVIDDVLSNEPLLEKLIPDEAGDWSTGTSYELKFLKTGRPIYKAVFRRRVSGSAG